MAQAAKRNSEVKSAVPGRRVQVGGIIFLSFVVAAMVWVTYIVIAWMKDSERLPLSQLVVIGQRHYTTNDDIRQTILALGPPGTFMTQNVNIIQQQIERLPWVHWASVRKQWPDLLKIYVVEYAPVARWNGQYFLDVQGTAFSLPDAKVINQPLPMLYGPEGSGKEVFVGYSAMNRLMMAGKFKIKSVVMSPRRSWQLFLDNDVRLELGRDEQSKRLQRFMQLYPMLVQQGISANKQIGYIDLRYETGASVGWVVVEDEAKQAQATRPMTTSGAEKPSRLDDNE